uniref:YokE-like PH domain-containing protein n=1 Tax=Dictyoglomus thermophilum TaxID=14 RepID=A0A7C3MJ94_DICTH
MEIKGRPATIWLSLPSDLLIGESVLDIKDDLLIEKRKVFFEERYTYLLLSEIEGIEITQKGDKIFSFLFFAFLAGRLYFLSFISLLIYLLWRPTFLIVHGKNLQIGISINQKDIKPYVEFANNLIEKVKEYKKH